MTLLSVTDKYFAAAKNLQVDIFDHTNHFIIDIPSSAKPEENDHVCDVTISSDNKYLAVITSNSKQLLIYDLPTQNRKVFSLPRSASKIRFSANNTHILIADKTGDVLCYEIAKTESAGTKLMGYLSLLLDVLQTNDENYIITSDRDEKIRVSCYPNTFNIHTYCLGHKEFVNHLEFLPHNDKYLVSTSGDGTVKIWDYLQGKLCYTFDTNKDLIDTNKKQEFINAMDEDGMEVDFLPIVHFTTTLRDENTSVVAITLHSCNDIFIYSISYNNNFSHKLETLLALEEFPTSIQLHCLSLFIYNETKCIIKVFNKLYTNGTISLQPSKEIQVFGELSSNGDDTHKNISVENQLELIKVLYKRKFDNVQEYQERKRQRLEKSGLKNND